MFSDLIDSAIKLGDSSHHSVTVTQVLDMKKEWAAVKSTLAKQSSAIKVNERKTKSLLISYSK